MKRMSLLGILLLFLASDLPGQSALRSTAKSYVERAAKEMGGERILSSIKSVRLEFRGHSYLLDDSQFQRGTHDDGVLPGTQVALHQ